MAHCLEGLSRLEYRGYDSAGIVGFDVNLGFHCVKAVGKLRNLKEKAGHLKMDAAVAHTRWATHGKPNEANAHPHFDQHGKVAVVHNGIIENHGALRSSLVERFQVQFSSQTDTEVIAQLIGASSEKDLLSKVVEATSQMEGAWACALTHRDFPGTLIGFTRSCPLIVAINRATGQTFIASDINALQGDQLEIAYLLDGEIAVLKPGSLAIYDAKGQLLDKPLIATSGGSANISKGNFAHFMLKEIFEQPETVYAALQSPVDIRFAFNKIAILACGTSYHAGCLAARMLESEARIPTAAYIGSEFRYQSPLIDDKTLVLAISQSGETADTVAAVREAKARGAKVVALCNAERSMLTREADQTLLLRAGPEISVCSTKAFTSQLAVLTKLTLHLAKKEDAMLADLPALVSTVLYRAHLIEEVAKKFAACEHFFYIGRQTMYFAAMEGALKLKEIAYVDANAYAAGEMKHGPISLLSDSLPVVVFGCHEPTRDKLASNVQECKARGAPIIAFGFEDDHHLQELADHFIPLPRTSDLLAPIPISVAGQLLAYYIARERGTEIDQPRNLAKSVTVE